jgi:oligopeptide transport system substrate-binding protein
MRRHVTLLFLTLFILGCTGTSRAQSQSKSGGILEAALNKTVLSLYPPEAYAFQDLKVVNQVYEGLMRFEPSTLEPTLGLAHSYTISEDGLTYTFRLRTNAQFHDNDCFANGKGRAVTASDVKTCYERLCIAFEENTNAWILGELVVGADELHEASEFGDTSIHNISGVVALNDSVLEINLKKPGYDFLHRLALPSTSIYPPEAVDYYGNGLNMQMVGTGPFQQKSVNASKLIELERNPNYWDKDEHGTRLPYLDGIRFQIIRNAGKQFSAFQAGELHVCGPENVDLGVFMDQNELKPSLANQQMLVGPQLFTSFYGFGLHRPIFAKKEVRQAINYAIDRQALVDEVFDGRAQIGVHGIIPSGIEGYDVSKINGYTFDPAKAKELLAAAGHRDGKKLPVIRLNINNKKREVNEQVAHIVQRMLLENLNIAVDIEILPFSDHLMVVAAGEATFWRDGWISDYASPDNFLHLLYGAEVPENTNEPSVTNVVRFTDEAFDASYEKAQTAQSDRARMDYFMEAEQRAVDEAAIAPLYYMNSYLFTQKSVKNIAVNLSNTYFFRSVFLAQ